VPLRGISASRWYGIEWIIRPLPRAWFSPTIREAHPTSGRWPSSFSSPHVNKRLKEKDTYCPGD
jgi:hypothetical protein